jgi:hypothetical protein
MWTGPGQGTGARHTAALLRAFLSSSGEKC